MDDWDMEDAVSGMGRVASTPHTHSERRVNQEAGPDNKRLPSGATAPGLVFS